MQCFRCRAENAEGSRFCGHCGTPFGTVPPGAEQPLHMTDPTSRMPAAAGTVHPGFPPLGRDGRPILADESLGGSLQVPVSRGAQAVKVMLIIALDVAMAVVGVVLLTRDRGPGAARPDAGVVVATADGGVVSPSPETPDPVPPDLDPGPGPGPGPRPGKTGPKAVPDASVRPPVAVDAGPVVTPPAPDAAPVPTATPDAAPVVTPPAPPDAGTADPPDTAEDQRAQVARWLSKSQSRLSRCYENATKALPEDQALTGEVDISFEVMPTGGTANVTVVRNTTESNQLAACLSATVSDWTFEPFQGEAVTFQRTFRFAPQK